MQPTDGQPMSSPHDGVPASPPPNGRWPVSLLAATGAVAALVIAAVVVVVTAGGDGGSDPEEAAVLGSALATTATTQSNSGTVASSTTTAPDDGGGGGGGGEGDCTGATTSADLPEVSIPAEASPPPAPEGGGMPGWPVDIMTGEELPGLGEIVVDLEEGGYADFPVHLDMDKRTALISAADDGIQTEIEVFAPDGSSEGCWVNSGEPEVISGLEWISSDQLPATGTYVVRVVHTGGSHGPFILRFFADP
jgi:hypothetical protein